MITIIFKAVEKCNSNCVYCEVIAKRQNAIMEYGLLKEVLQKINDYLVKYTEEEINITWHGGEVCLLGATYFLKAIEFLDKYCPTTKKRIRHAIQSNLTLINEEIIDAFKILGIKTVGTSYEYIPLDAILVNGSINTKAPHCEWVTHFMTNYFEPITGLMMR